MRMNKTMARHGGEITKAIRNHRYEVTESGLLLRNGSGLHIGGAFKTNDYGGPVGIAIDPNLFVTEGLIYAINAAFAGGSQISSWFLALFSNDYEPAATLTAANFASVAGEVTAGITNATRPAWSKTAATVTPDVGNSGSEALFTYATGGPYDIYGCALLSNSTKGSTAGVIAAATRFDVSRLNQIAGDKLGVEYIISAEDAA